MCGRDGGHHGPRCLGIGGKQPTINNKHRGHINDTILFCSSQTQIIVSQYHLFPFFVQLSTPTFLLVCLPLCWIQLLLYPPPITLIRERLYHVYSSSDLVFLIALQDQSLSILVVRTITDIFPLIQKFLRTVQLPPNCLLTITSQY